MQAQHVPLELNPKAITEDTTVLIIGTNSYRDHRDLISGINVKEFIERGGTVIKFGEWGGEYAFMKCGVSGRRGGGSDVRITSAGKEVLGGYDGLSSYQSILEPERGLQFEALLVNDKKEVVGLKAQVGKGFLFCFGIEPGATADKPFMTSVMTHLLEQRPPQR